MINYKPGDSEIADNFKRVMGYYPWEPQPSDPPEFRAALEELAAIHERNMGEVRTDSECLLGLRLNGRGKVQR